MSAKIRANKPTPAPAPTEPPAPAAAAVASAETELSPPPPAWIDDTSNPRKQLIAKVALVAVWIYVAALWLLALDQTFKWGIFGP
jgi:hypothetical protein